MTTINDALGALVQAAGFDMAEVSALYARANSGQLELVTRDGIKRVALDADAVAPKKAAKKATAKKPDDTGA